MTAQAIKRGAVWVGDTRSWGERKGKARKNVPHHKLIYGDFTFTYAKLKVAWCSFSSKKIYNIISEHIYGGLYQHKHLNEAESKICIRNIQSTHISENMRDVAWLISVGRLAVRCVVKWSCYVTTKLCPAANCDEDETIEHLLIHCERSVDVWKRLKALGVKFDINVKSI